MKIKLLNCTCSDGFKSRKLDDPNCCACSCDYNDIAQKLNSVTADRDALVAQVEKLREQFGGQVLEAHALSCMVKDIQSALDDFSGFPGTDEQVANLAEVIRKTPAQCLAEVRAQAVEEFTKYIDDIGELSFDDISFLGVESEKYANQLRQQGKAGA